MANTYGGSFVMRLDEDTDYAIGKSIVEISKGTGERYSKGRFVDDFLKYCFLTNRNEEIIKNFEKAKIASSKLKKTTSYI